MKKVIFCVICAIGGWMLTACDDFDIVETAYDEDMQTNPERQTATPPAIDASWQLQLIPDVGRQADNLFVYKDLKYNAIFSRTLGWNGGSGGISTKLPDGSILWAFNDSYFGVVDPANRARLSGNVPLNALLVQRAVNGTLGETSDDLIALADYVEYTDPASEKYLWGRTYLRHPNGNKTDAQIEAGEIDNSGRYYYPGSAVITNGKVQMLWCAFTTAGSTVNGTSIATFSLDGTIPVNRYNAQVPDYLPQAGDYMYREQFDELVKTNRIFFGQAVCNGNDGHYYLYGVRGSNVNVARTATLDLNSQWEYYVRDTQTGLMQWRSEPPSTETRNDDSSRSNIMANGYVAIQPTVFQQDGTYYMVAQAVANATEVYVYTASAPEGPFDNQKLLFNLPSFIDKVGLTAYNQIGQVNVHPELSRAGELVISACTKVSTAADNYTYPGSADFSRPFFFRIFNWKEVYKDAD